MQILFRFGQNQRGSVAIIVALLFVPILLALGAGIDFARYEMYRVQMQTALDRGVLAATSLNQTVPTDQIIAEYMFANLSFRDGVEIESEETHGTNFKLVAADAAYDMPTVFLRMIDIETMRIDVTSKAEERRQNIEISLALDISGSMMDSPQRIRALRPAATTFVNTVLNGESSEYTSVSLIPYAGQVSIGASLFDQLGGLRRHSWSSCFSFQSAELGSSNISFSNRTQVDHFTRWNFGNARNPSPTGPDRKNAPWCPTDNAAMTVFSNDASLLANRIRTIETFDGTGTANAMNWAYLLLNPSGRSVAQAANTLGMINPAFANRPASFNDATTAKFIVLMTDGMITEQFRQDPLTPQNTQHRQYALGIYNPEFIHNPSQTRSWIVHQTQNANAVRTDFYRICDEAKRNGITIFTIALQVAENHKEEMRRCASPNSFYDVSGLDIAAAFSDIASRIGALRLIQ